MDSGCSHHVCHERELFSTFAKSSGLVVMGNDQSCPIEGVGLVKIRMFDGVLRTLQEVKYIPQVRKNLISLGTLDARGYRTEAEAGVMEVMDKNKVIMKAIRQRRNLFVLQGNACNGDVFAVTNQVEMPQL